MTITPEEELHAPGLTDVRMMTVAHTNFRRELTLSVPAVRATPAGDHRRSREVAGHVGLFLGAVHHHHAIEEDLLWEPLGARVPDAVAPLVQLMMVQHAGVHERLVEAERLLGTWTSSAATNDREELADALQDLVAALCEHLDTEETKVLPLMARHITADEWDEFIRQGMESIPRRLMLVGFGMMLYEGDPAAVAPELRKLPAPLRPLLPALGRRAYRRYALRIHGTSTPTRAYAVGSAFPSQPSSG